MKHLKLFENKIMDDILDKISSTGEKSLTSWEKEYLLSIDTPRQIEMEDELENDSTEEVNFENEESDILDSEKDIHVQELEMFWDNLDDEDVNEFIETFQAGDHGTTRWVDLPNDIKSKFQMYLVQKGYINR